MKRLLAFFTRLFSRDAAAKFEAGLAVCAPYFKRALEVSEVIAELTPNRTDDQILAAIKHFAVPVVLGSTSDRTALLREVAVAALAKQFPAAPERQLNRALEVAYGAVKP